jgi:hypothetical protein
VGLCGLDCSGELVETIKINTWYESVHKLPRLPNTHETFVFLTGDGLLGCDAVCVPTFRRNTPSPYSALIVQFEFGEVYNMVVISTAGQ